MTYCSWCQTCRNGKHRHGLCEWHSHQNADPALTVYFRSEPQCSSLSVRRTEASSILAKPVFHPNSSKPEFRQVDHTCTGCRDILWIMWPCTALRCLSNTISICYHWAVACLGLPGPGHQNQASISAQKAVLDSPGAKAFEREVCDVKHWDEMARASCSQPWQTKTRKHEQHCFICASCFSVLRLNQSL